MGHYATKTRLVDVVLNGEYHGIYLLCEKIKRDASRVDISKLTPVEITEPDMTGGYILKFDYWDNSNSWQLNHSPIGYPGLDIHMVHVEPQMNELAPQQLTYIHNYIDDFETALYGPNFDDPNLGYRAYIGVGSFIDYLIIGELTRNIDGYKKSRYFYKDKNKLDGSVRKLKAGPVWDFDWSQKDMWSGSEDGSQWMYSDCDQDVNAPGWYIRLLEDTLFANELRCRYDDLRRTILSQDYLFEKIDSVANEVSESQNWHYKVWQHMGQATGTGEVQAPSQTYAQEVQSLKDWYTRRLTWLDANLLCTLNGCSMTGLQDLVSLHKIAAYPNPFESAVTIEWSQGNLVGATVRLRDGAGRIIQEKVIESLAGIEQTTVLSGLDDLSKGLYFLELTLGSEKGILKISK